MAAGPRLWRTAWLPETRHLPVMIMLILFTVFL
jgi:hypothetical protein